MAKKNTKIAAAKRAAAKVKAKKTTKTKKASWSAQGQNPPQSKAYKEVNDKVVPAKPIGYRWTTDGAKKLGKNPDVRPSTADIEKYRGKTFRLKGEDRRYLYTEKRADKSDKNRQSKFEDGGTMGAGSYEAGGTTGAGSFELGGTTGAGTFKKGGVSQTAGQYGTYSKQADGQMMAKPVGYRYTDKLAKRLGVNPYSRPTKAHIEKYLGNGIYMETRRDHTDVKPSKNYISLQDGGTMGAGSYETGGTLGAGSFAKGGSSQTAGQYGTYNRQADGQMMAKPVGYRYTDKLAKRLGKNAYSRPTKEHIEKYLGNGVYKETRRDHTDVKPSKNYISLQDGGTMGAGSYETGGTLGAGSYEAGGTTGAGSFAKGGSPFSGRYKNPYNKAMDADKTAKPIGYRFTNKLAKRLGKSVYARPTVAEIQKYLDRGVYYEARQDKSDQKPSKNYQSLESGGTMGAGSYESGGTLGAGSYQSGGTLGAGSFAKGSVVRISNSSAREYTENMMPFKANNLEGKTLDNGDYVVLSYGYYPIWWYCKKEGKWYGNRDKYSMTTAKHVSQSRPTYDAEMLSHKELTEKMMKHGSEYDAGGVIDNILLNKEGYTNTDIGGTLMSQASTTPHMEIDNPAF